MIYSSCERTGLLPALPLFSQESAGGISFLQIVLGAYLVKWHHRIIFKSHQLISISLAVIDIVRIHARHRRFVSVEVEKHRRGTCFAVPPSSSIRRLGQVVNSQIRVVHNLR